MAVIDIRAWPVAMMVDRLLTHVGIDDGLKNEVRREYISEAVELTKKERKAGANEFKGEILMALYGDGGRHEMNADIARISVGGEVADVVLTDAERAYVTSVIINTFKEKYPDPQFGFPQIGVRV